MKTTKANLLLHPIRLQIIQALISRPLTPQQLAEVLPDVPQATLYRQINKLATAGILQVIDERPVRGTVEKVYALAEQRAILTLEDLAHASKDDHMHYFTTFVASLLDGFWRYLQQEKIDFVADGVGYRQVAFYLSDEEFLQMAAALNAALLPALANRPGPGRRRRLLTTIVMPSSDVPSSDEGSDSM